MWWSMDPGLCFLYIPSGVGRVWLPGLSVFGGPVETPRIDEKESFLKSFHEAEFFLLEKTLRSFLLVDGPDLSDKFRVNNHEMINATNGRAVSHSLIASSFRVPTSAGHLSIYKQDHDSSCLDSTNIQRKNTETKHGRL